ncbi:MAG: ABC transporter substrate-binding protein [Hyphomicrobiaceae bacterium]
MRRMLMLASASVVAAGLWAASASAEDKMTLVGWGGAASEAINKAVVQPFMQKTGVKVTEDGAGPEMAKIRAMVEAGTVTWDVVQIESGAVIEGCGTTFETIDWAKLGLDRSKFIGADMTDCGIPLWLWANVIAYDTTKLNPGPTSINDLFDLKKFPGKRALRKRPDANLEWALIADGVPAADVYKVLATPEGVDRAFKKLDTIKSEVVWWDAGAQPPQLLADGQVVMTSAYNGRITSAINTDKKPFKIVWDHQVYDFDWYAVVKGTLNLDAAMKYMAFQGMPEQGEAIANIIPYGPGNRDATAKLSPEVLATLPTAPENMTTAVQVDTKFWADNGAQLIERFNAWLAQ